MNVISLLAREKGEKLDSNLNHQIPIRKGARWEEECESSNSRKEQNKWFFPSVLQPIEDQYIVT